MAVNENDIGLVSYEEFDDHQNNSDSNIQHVTATEKSAWNAKADNTALAGHKNASVLDHPDESVTTGKIADGAVTRDKLDSTTVITPLDAAGSHIANTSNPHEVTKSQVGLGNVDNVKQATKQELDTHTQAAKIDHPDGSVTTEKIADGAVEESKIGSGAVTEGKIGSGAVTEGKIGSGAVTTAKIAENAVETAKIKDGAVTEGKIGNSAITTAKIADSGVSTTKIADSAVTSDKLASAVKDDVNSRELSSNKGQPNGYAPLDANGKLPDSYLYGTTVKQYGVRWNGTSSTSCVRLGDAVGLTARAHKGSTESVVNDFDDIYPWSDIKTCNIDADGNIIAYAGDPKFNRNGVSVITTSSTVTVYKLNAKPLTVTSVTLNGATLTADTDYTYDATTGNLTLSELPTSEVADNMTVKHSVYDVMVEIPKFYYKRVKTGVVEEFWICGVQLPGYELHPLFYNDGVEVSKVFHSAYNASAYTDAVDNKVKLRSISGAQPRVRTTRANFRTYARNKGTIWGIEDISCVNALQLLYLVEYATTNSQSALGSGVDSLSYTANHKALEAATDSNTITIASTYKNVYKLGQRIEIGTSQGSNNKTSTPRTITAIETDEDAGQTTITFDGDPISVAVGNMMWNVAPLNGSCDSLNGKSGWVAGANNYADHYADVNYRGIEGFHGKLFRFIDGVNINNKVVHYSNSMADYADGVYSGKYRAIGYTNAASNGYISSFGYDEIAPWVMFPTGASGGSSTYIPDYYYQASGERLLLLGGGFSYGSYGGVFYFGCHNVLSDSGLSCGAHLLVKKP